MRTGRELLRASSPRVPRLHLCRVIPPYGTQRQYEGDSIQGRCIDIVSGATRIQISDSSPIVLSDGDQGTLYNGDGYQKYHTRVVVVHPSGQGPRVIDVYATPETYNYGDWPVINEYVRLTGQLPQGNLYNDALTLVNPAAGLMGYPRVYLDESTNDLEEDVSLDAEWIDSHGSSRSRTGMNLEAITSGRMLDLSGGTGDDWPTTVIDHMRISRGWACTFDWCVTVTMASEAHGVLPDHTYSITWSGGHIASATALEVDGTTVRLSGWAGDRPTNGLSISIDVSYGEGNITGIAPTLTIPSAAALGAGAVSGVLHIDNKALPGITMSGKIGSTVFVMANMDNAYACPDLSGRSARLNQVEVYGRFLGWHIRQRDVNPDALDMPAGTLVTVEWEGGERTWIQVTWCDHQTLCVVGEGMDPWPDIDATVTVTAFDMVRLKAHSLHHMVTAGCVLSISWDLGNHHYVGSITNAVVSYVIGADIYLHHWTGDPIPWAECGQGMHVWWWLTSSKLNGITVTSPRAGAGRPGFWEVDETGPYVQIITQVYTGRWAVSPDTDPIAVIRPGLTAGMPVILMWRDPASYQWRIMQGLNITSVSGDTDDILRFNLSGFWGSAPPAEHTPIIVFAGPTLGRLYSDVIYGGPALCVLLPGSTEDQYYLHTTAVAELGEDLSRMSGKIWPISVWW